MGCIWLMARKPVSGTAGHRMSRPTVENLRRRTSFLRVSRAISAQEPSVQDRIRLLDQRRASSRNPAEPKMEARDPVTDRGLNICRTRNRPDACAIGGEGSGSALQRCGSGCCRRDDRRARNGDDGIGRSDHGRVVEDHASHLGYSQKSPEFLSSRTLSKTAAFATLPSAAEPRTFTPFTLLAIFESVTNTRLLAAPFTKTP